METLTFTVVKGGQGLGLNIYGGNDSGEEEPGIFISEVAEDGAAARAGLQAGDKIVKVGDTDITNVPHDTAVAAFLNSGASVDVVVERASNSDTRILMLDNPLHESNGDAATTEAAKDALQNGTRTDRAREAYKQGDVELSRLVHAMAPEKHQSEAGQYIKSMVFGGLDGIITTFAVVASVAGANLDTDVILVLGFSNLLGDGISMGFGEYLSAHSENSYIRHERDREKWEFENFPEGEIDEMVELYKEKGFEEEDARQIMTLMSKKPDHFIDHMMVQELGLMTPDEDEKPWKNGMVMFTAFMLFGFLPLLAYVAFGHAGLSDGGLFGIACGLTATALFILGAAKSRFGTETWWQSGLWVVANGALAAGAAYLVGYVASQIVSINENC